MHAAKVRFLFETCKFSDKKVLIKVHFSSFRHKISLFHLFFRDFICRYKKLLLSLQTKFTNTIYNYGTRTNETRNPVAL